MSLWITEKLGVLEHPVVMDTAWEASMEVTDAFEIVVDNEHCQGVPHLPPMIVSSVG